MKTETLRARNVVDATRLGAWLRSGEGIGWLAAGTMPNSLHRMPSVYLFLACVFCYSCPFLFVVFCLFLFLFCSHWSLVDVPLIFFCPADHVPDCQPRILLGMVEARSVNVKKTTILHFFVPPQTTFPLVRLQQVFKYKGQCIIYGTGRSSHQEFSQCCCCCFLHINRSGLNHTQYYTWLPIRYVVCWTERDQRNIYHAPMRAKEKHKQTKNDKEKGTRITKYTCQKKIDEGHSIERV